MSDPRWLTIAKGELGVQETPGPRHTPRVVEYGRSLGVLDDETAWCAAFLDWVMDRAGPGGTNKLNARSYLNWGVPLERPVPGAVMVYWRGSPDGWQGHVHLFTRENATHYYGIGGNQSNSVNEAPYPKGRLLGIRWPEGYNLDGTPITSPQPVEPPRREGGDTGRSERPARRTGRNAIIAAIAAVIAAIAAAFFGGDGTPPIFPQ